jgi:pimeloyl-ACP methyl ester carboxylesterase
MYFTSDDITIYYEKYGNSKKSIIILPGWGDNRKTFSYMINFLKEFFTVYIFDYPGFGNSPFPNKNLTIYDYSELINNWIKELEIDNPILIGHSFGGRIIITLLGYYQYDYKNIILIDSAGIKPKKTLRKLLRTYTYKFLKSIKKILPKKYRESYQNFLFSIFASSDYKNLNPNMMRTFKNIVNEDLKPYLKYIKAKTLLIWGNKDDDTPIKDANIMNKLITNSELVVIDNTNHFVYLQKPYLINQIIYEQLKDEIN